MNKLETITELLVNELTDFENNVKRLENSLEKTESLRVRFDIDPVKGLISQLEEFGKRENARRNQYLQRLERNLKEAKIYPKWAVITFGVMLIIGMCSLFYAYTIKSGLEEEKQAAYQQGIQAYENYLDRFFEAHPESEKKFKAWQDQINQEK